jgi:hypothetical protein
VSRLVGSEMCIRDSSNVVAIAMKMAAATPFQRTLSIVFSIAIYPRVPFSRE